MDDWLVGQFINPVIGWFAEMILGALNVLWDLLAATVFVSPDVTRLPQVTAFADTSLAIVNTCYVLAFLWVAVLVMSRDTIQSRVGPGDLIPRLVIGLIAANFAIPICSTAIELVNALTAALTGQDITAPGSLQQLRVTTAAALSGQTGTSPVGFLLLLIGLLITVLLGTLVVQWIIRLGLLVITVGVAPIALALHGTAQTEGAAKLWWRTLLGCLGTVTVQAVALHTTLRIFLAPDANLPVLGLPGDPGAVMNLLIVVCLLLGVVKIPALMSRYVTQSRPNPMGTILRVVFVQHLTRGLSRAVGSRGGAARAVGGKGGGPGMTGGGAAARPWPVNTGGGGGARPRPAPSSPALLIGGSAPRPPAPASGGGPGRAGTAYPTVRSVRPYRREEIATGVDLYTRSLKARAGSPLRKAP
ncbi:conjugal transfer protein TrbL family protein [Micromonospora sp. NPDC047187]|uniref:conjugal transfer protein TrbL family protein n=1 Tax=Micromonospora sp. NPDC047187 TaxID=3155262 RepID=UPI00340777AC